MAVTLISLSVHCSGSVSVSVAAVDGLALTSEAGAITSSGLGDGSALGSADSAAVGVAEDVAAVFCAPPLPAPRTASVTMRTATSSAPSTMARRRQ
ncbi:hypothetical protein ACFQY4_01600 [Catellatospora bangladeshensis]|uniref:hypothetical protein n=1 Tax=Catellatospora bangladeshensis TaxID=310355 RepID=UPI00360BD232